MSNMTINNNVQNTNVYTNMKRTEEDNEKSSKKIASGERTNEAGNDAVALAISQALLSQIGGLEQGSDNSLDGMSLVQTADAGLSQVTDMVQRARELTVQASNGTYSESDKAIINNEISEISGAIGDVAKNTQFNGQHLLDGSNTEFNIQTGANAGDSTTLDFSDADITGLNILSGDIDVTRDTDEILKALDGDLETLSNARSELGAYSNSLGYNVNTNNVTSSNLSKANSSLADTDIAKEATNLNKSMFFRAAQMNIMMQNNVQAESLMRILN